MKVYLLILNKVKPGILGGEWEPKPAFAVETFTEFGYLITMK